MGVYAHLVCPLLPRTKGWLWQPIWIIHWGRVNSWHLKHDILHRFWLHIPALGVLKWCISEVNEFLRRNTNCSNKHITCTYKVTSAASICLHTWSFCDRHIFYTYTSCACKICNGACICMVDTLTCMHGVQRVKKHNYYSSSNQTCHVRGWKSSNYLHACIITLTFYSHHCSCKIHNGCVHMHACIYELAWRPKS